jgi:hypothetical protein
MDKMAWKIVRGSLVEDMNCRDMQTDDKGNYRVDFQTEGTDMKKMKSTDGNPTKAKFHNEFFIETTRESS